MFARMDALNRHLRSEGGAECARILEGQGLDGGPGTAPPVANTRRGETSGKRRMLITIGD